MSPRALHHEVDQQLARVLTQHEVGLSQPQDRMLQLDAVPAGACFSKPRTNALLRERPPGDVWQLYVDEDLAYTGEDPQQQAVFSGQHRRGWRELVLTRPLLGDVNAAILCLLDRLESDVRGKAPAALGSADPPRRAVKASLDPAPLNTTLARWGRLLAPPQLTGAEEPTFAQSEAIRKTAETLTRGLPPFCPLLTGQTGVGKTLAARRAAGELLNRGLAERVVEASGASICAGAIFWPERDDRLRQLLEAALREEGTLLILEQVDLVLLKSETACSLLADALDRGLKMIAVARSASLGRELRGDRALRRRLEPTPLAEPEPEELARILRQRLATHRLAARLEAAPSVLPLVASLSAGRRGANPGKALGLLEAALCRAIYSDQPCLGPDDIYHLVPCSDTT